MRDIELPVLKFGDNKDFEIELHRRVNEYFKSSGISNTATFSMYVKSVVVFLLFITTYLVLLLLTSELWQGVALSIFLGFSLVGIGVNIQHDASHNAYSKRRFVNRSIALTLDIIGASSYLWRWKHNRFHHSFTNIAGFDTDIDFGTLGRIAPSAKRFRFHRWQHWYFWIFYCLFAIKWQLFDDFYSVIRGCLGNHKIPRPKGSELVIFIAGKAVFFSLAFGVPFLFHPIIDVLFCYLITITTTGLTLSIIFIFPHAVGESEFPIPDKVTGRIIYPRAIHQCRVTVDFMRRNPVVTWLVGGLNFHREHHLFPQICHVHYSKIAGIVDDVCDKFRVPHAEHRSYLAGLASHYRWLRRMGKQDA